MRVDRDAVATVRGEPGSFARSVLEHRHPAIVAQVRAGAPYGPEQLRRLDALLADTLHGTVTPPPPDAPDERWPDAHAWAAWLAPHRDRTWFDVPFLVAEAWFYRRLLDAVAFVEPGAWQGVDPFAGPKTAELAAVPALTGPRPTRQALVTASLWGNRADLGFQLVAGDAPDPAPADADLVVDDSAALARLLDTAPPHLAWVCDNAGRELVADLLLLDRLLADAPASTITVHVKPVPHFVSDATARDLADCLRALTALGAPDAAERLRAAAAAGRLQVAASAFWAAPLELRDAPPDVAAALATDLVVLKGDLNYRRLVGDAAWPPDTPFADAVQLPGPVAVLRTLKSDVVVGLPPGRAEQLDADAPGWRTNGRHALIQVRP